MRGQLFANAGDGNRPEKWEKSCIVQWLQTMEIDRLLASLRFVSIDEFQSCRRATYRRCRNFHPDALA